MSKGKPNEIEKILRKGQLDSDPNTLIYDPDYLRRKLRALVRKVASDMDNMSDWENQINWREYCKETYGMELP